MSKFIVVATIFMLVFPCATSAQEVSSLPKETEDRTYRPEVEFFVDLSEAEVAEAAVGQLLRSPSGKPALDELRNVEKMMLIVKWSPEQWENFWGRFAGNAATSGFKEMESLQTIFGSSGKWGGGTWFGAFRIPNLVPRSLVNIVGCSSRGRGNCGKLRATSNWASKPVIRSFPSAVRTVEKQLRALASSPPELLVFPRFA